MSLDRGWYDLLLDDAGDGLSGSVWDKADIKALLDSVDAELARLDGQEASGAWTPFLTGSVGGTATYTTQVGLWSRSSEMIQLSGRITVANKGSLAGALNIGGFPFATAAATAQALSVGYFAGVPVNYVPKLFTNAGTTTAALYAAMGATAAAALDAANIVNGFDLIFGGTFSRA